MNIEDLREYCLSRKGAEESMPFGDDILVFKVMNKMFAFIYLIRKDERGLILNLKCNPEKAIELREKYNSIIPAYHMNKKHWNTLFFENNLPNQIIEYSIDHSLEEVIKNLPKKDQLAYNK